MECRDNKNSFDSEDEAKDYVKFLKTGIRFSKTFDHKKRITIYSCKNCGKFHTTSQSAADKRKYRRQERRK